jgi:hypothetical protein
VDGVSDVNGVLLWDATTAAITQLPISGLQLPQLLQLNVSTGPAQDLSVADKPPAKQRVAVPMLQPQC